MKAGVESLGENGLEVGWQGRFPHVEKPGKCISYLAVKPHKMLYQDGINHFMAKVDSLATQLLRRQMRKQL